MSVFGFGFENLGNQVSYNNFDVGCLLISVFTSQQLQSAEKSSNPDFEVEFYYKVQTREKFWVSNPEFQTRKRLFLGYF